MKFFFALLVFFFLTAAEGRSQICTGSLGDPVVNVTFGTGQNPGPPLPSRITNYIYSSAPCPGDGAYTIVNSTISCWGNTWHSLSEDHTPGDVNGYMMLANSSFNPGDFYTDTVSGLCNNTTYEFAVYVMNMLRDFACSGSGQLPNLTFRIQTVSGTTLATFNSGNIPMTSFPSWKQIGFYFTTPAGIDKVILRLTNNAQGGCGNDLMLDDITFRACGPEVKAAIAANAASTEVVVCEGGSKDFTFNATISAGYNNPVIQWQRSLNGGNWTDIAGATRASYTRTGADTGEFRYRFAVSEPGNLGSPNCRIFSNVLSLRVAPVPRVALTVNRPICVGGDVQFTSSGGGTYAWSGPAGFASTLSAPTIVAANLNAAGRYKVLVTSVYNCSKEDSADIVVFPRAVAQAGNDQTICEGESVTLTGTGGTDYAWSPVSTLNSSNMATTVARPLDTTMYLLRIRDANGCTAADSVMIFVLRKPTANAGIDTSIFEGGTAQLRGRVGGTSVTFAWTPATALANAGSLNPVASPRDNITYTLRTTSGVGCGTAEDEVFVRVFKTVSIPNAFSPNGDGVNDTWNIGQLSNYPEARLQVFNRYGKEIFRSSGYPRPWNGTVDGRPLAAGTYYYVINLKNGLAPLTGWVFIVR